MTSVHLKLKPFSCDICGSAFTQKPNLIQHIQEQHEGMKKKLQTKRAPKYKCEVCDKLFVTPAKLNVHETAVHLKLKPFKCDICDVSFSQKCHLKQHVEFQHEGRQREPPGKLERKYECKTCDKLFVTPSKLKRHIAPMHSQLLQ